MNTAQTSRGNNYGVCETKTNQTGSGVMTSPNPPRVRSGRFQNIARVGSGRFQNIARVGSGRFQNIARVGSGRFQNIAQVGSRRWREEVLKILQVGAGVVSELTGRVGSGQAATRNRRDPQEGTREQPGKKWLGYKHTKPRNVLTQDQDQANPTPTKNILDVSFRPFYPQPHESSHESSHEPSHESSHEPCNESCHESSHGT